MHDDNNWVKARSSLVWMAAIVTAFAAVAWIERESGRELIARQQASAPVAAAPAATLPASPDLPTADPALRALTEQERQWARIAWTYFTRNTDPSTGLTPAVEGFPSTTLWDASSSLLALLAARELALVDEPEFDQRLARALESLGKLPLHAGVLPNKTYDVRSLAMTDYRNQPSAAGNGWSALDIARLAVPLQAIAWQHPRHTEAARRVIARWDTSRLVQGGQLRGLQVADGGTPQSTQEGRLGYEQYAARALAPLALDVERAAVPLAHLRWTAVQGIEVPADTRDPQRFGAVAPVLSEPWILHGLEFGWTGATRELAWRVYRAQEERAKATGTPTAVTEDHVDRAPYFVYNAVLHAGKPWMAVSDKGEELPALRTLSTKAAFGWHALWRTPYTTQLVDKVAPLHDPARGWYAGLYDADGQPNKSVNANTNAVVLESLAAIVRGPALRIR